MGNVKKLLGLYAYGMFQKLFAWSVRYVLRTPQISICKFEPDREAEVAWSVSYAPGPAKFTRG